MIRYIVAILALTLIAFGIFAQGNTKTSHEETTVSEPLVVESIEVAIVDPYENMSDAERVKGIVIEP